MVGRRSAKRKASYDVPAVRSGIGLIKLLCDSDRPLGVSEISHSLGVNKNMVFRLLRTLCEEGWVIQEKEGPKYRMSLQPFHHTSKPVGRMNLRVAATGALQELWTETGESTYLGVLDVDRVLYIEHLDATGSIKIAGKVGGRYLLHCSAPGKALLAHAGDGLFDRLAKEGFQRLTPRTICDPRELREDLKRIVERGYSLDVEEYANGLMCFAAPVRNYAGAVVGTTGISVLTLNYGLDEMVGRLGPKVLKAAEETSRSMGACADERAAT